MSTALHPNCINLGFPCSFFPQQRCQQDSPQQASQSRARGHSGEQRGFAAQKMKNKGGDSPIPAPAWYPPSWHVARRTMAGIRARDAPLGKGSQGDPWALIPLRQGFLPVVTAGREEIFKGWAETLTRSERLLQIGRGCWELARCASTSAVLCPRGGTDQPRVTPTPSW